ncbi:hypothetical protein MUK42_32714 [Musa troglodytarum]|uniref:Uncharacterized protein n=1 Tax=Musa troglodytarum TaxID=320322 RepID=A0A9E7FCG6_9LILI|nr:hypothetical protein MUK42_32714 [Musa troglodytarum]
MAIFFLLIYIFIIHLICLPPFLPSSAFFVGLLLDSTTPLPFSADCFLLSSSSLVDRLPPPIEEQGHGVCCKLV